MTNRSLLGLIFAGCAATAPNLEFTVETGAVTVNSQRVAGTTQKLGPTGKGEAKVLQRGGDPNKYAVLMRKHDSNGDGNPDYRDFTRTDQIGLGPYRVELVIDPKNCLVLEFEYSGTTRKLKKTTTVECRTLER